jgi:hypothetical protein
VRVGYLHSDEIERSVVEERSVEITEVLLCSAVITTENATEESYVLDVVHVLSPAEYGVNWAVNISVNNSSPSKVSAKERERERFLLFFFVFFFFQSLLSHRFSLAVHYAYPYLLPLQKKRESNKEKQTSHSLLAPPPPIYT